MTRTIALVVALGLLAAGCGDDDSAGEPADRPTTTAAAGASTTDPDDTATTVAAATDGDWCDAGEGVFTGIIGLTNVYFSRVSSVDDRPLDDAERAEIRADTELIGANVDAFVALAPDGFGAELAPATTGMRAFLEGLASVDHDYVRYVQTTDEDELPTLDVDDDTRRRLLDLLEAECPEVAALLAPAGG